MQKQSVVEKVTLHLKQTKLTKKHACVQFEYQENYILG